jgi:acetyltransferase-like isoleucine patch superfamily enzyme
MEIGDNVRISRRAVLDYSKNPKGIHIGSNSMIAGNVIILAHDHVRGLLTDTFLGEYVFVGGGSIIMPGVKIGNHVVVGAGSVVTKDIPDHSIAVGNPARVIRKGVVLSEDCQIINNGQRVE